MKWNRLRGSAFLLLASLIWGCAFAFQSMAAASIGPWLFNGVRFLLGGIEILILSPLLSKLEADHPADSDGNLFRCGVIGGIILLCASVLQQAGIRFTTAGKAGFITSLYVVLVPLAEVLLFHRKMRGTVPAAAFLALGALFLLSKPEEGTIGKGDGLVLLSAFAFAAHILYIDRIKDRVSAVRFSCVQFLAAGMIGLAGAFLFEGLDRSLPKEAVGPILYAGLCSAGLGYTFQALGQKDADPSSAGILLSLESVFSALAGFLLLHETLSMRELFGCALMFAAVILSQR